MTTGFRIRCLTSLPFITPLPWPRIVTCPSYAHFRFSAEVGLFAYCFLNIYSDFAYYKEVFDFRGSFGFSYTPPPSTTVSHAGVRGEGRALQNKMAHGRFTTSLHLLSCITTYCPQKKIRRN